MNDCDLHKLCFYYVLVRYDSTSVWSFITNHLILTLLYCNFSHV